MTTADHVGANGRTWTQDQEWERQWWGDACVNTFGEEAKALTYLDRVGWVNIPQDGHWPVYPLGGRSVIDIGGGPCSPLLKTVGGASLTVWDPCDYPPWTMDRYIAAGIVATRLPAELLPVLGEPFYDEALLLNVLEHTMDPAEIVRRARTVAKRLRIFEWVGTPPTPGHPHSLTVPTLRDWCGIEGTTETFTGENGLYGTAWYGVTE